MKRIKIFISSVQSEFSEERAFPLPENASPTQLLTHLSLMDEKGRLSNSAVLLFGKRPQAASAGAGKHVR